MKLSNAAKYFLLSLSLLGSLLVGGCFSSSSNSANVPLALDAAQYSLQQGNSVSVTVTNQGNLVALNVAAFSLPSGVSATPCSSIAPGQSCVMTVTASNSAAVGTSTIEIRGSNTNTVAASLVLTAVNGDFTSPPGAAVQSIVSDSNYVYAATFGGGVFRKTATGHWAAINTGLTNQYILSLAMGSDGTLYSGSTDSQVYKFNGESWTLLAEAGLPSGSAVTSLAIDGSGNIFAKVNTGSGQSAVLALYELQPNGSSWSLVTGFTGTISFLSGNNGHVAMVTTSSSPIVYQWNGSGFTSLPSPPSATTIGSLAVNEAGTIFVGTKQSNTFYVSLYANSQWTPISVPFLSNVILPQGTSEFYCVGINQGAPAVEYYDGAVHSISPSFEGGSFFILPQGLALLNNTLYMASIYSGVLSYQGSTWSYNNTGLNAAAISSMLWNNGSLYAGEISPTLTGTPAEIAYVNTK